jgi:hypothetical protein
VSTAEPIALIASSTEQETELRQRVLIFSVAVFLVSVPVFFQAPLVRFLPWASLGLTVCLWAIGKKLLIHPGKQIWGDLLVGFTWTWLSGSLYWGWMRWEPFLHLPVESIGLPFALWGIWKGRSQVGNGFYLGSLFGTAITDIYFYLVNLIPHWRSLMRVESDLAGSIFQSAIGQVQTPWGMSWAVGLASLLFLVSLFPLRSGKLHWWAFSGAVLSTILVDGLFWLAASLA